MSISETGDSGLVKSGETFDRRSFRIQWGRAFRALRKLIANKEDTGQVFEIMRALAGKSAPRGYARLLTSERGGQIAYRRPELVSILSDHEFLSRLPEGSVGRAYLHFVTSENISAEGLVAAQREVKDIDLDREHPVAWYGRRLRDVHDIWHVLTGYGRDALGEACVVAFSYPQTSAKGFALIAVAGAHKIAQELKGQPVRRAVWEAYRNGRKAAWLPGEDYLKLLAEPLEAARRRLNIPRPTTYESVPAQFRNGNMTH